jgi:hypothetical protein
VNAQMASDLSKVIPKLRNTLPEQQATFPPNQDPAVIE